MRFDGKTTKRRITKWGLSELSSVKSGAQAPAKATILKISANDKRELLNTALRDKFGQRSLDKPVDLWVHDYDDQYVCYWHSGKTYVDGYGMVGADVQFADEPIEVERKEHYVSADGTQFFKSTEQVDVTLTEKLSEAGFTPDEIPIVKSAVDVTGDIGAQVNALATQFGKAKTASVDGEQHPAKDFAYVPDADKPSTWKLPIFDAKHVSAAVAALGKGYRGKKVSIPDGERDKVLATVRRAYREHYPDKDLPELLEKSGDNPMPDPKTPEQLQKELDAANARTADLEVLAKMSDAEKTYMSKMDEDGKKKFMAMTEEERKKAMKTAKAADETFAMADGQVIAKSDVGEAAFAVMKSQNEQLQKVHEEKATRDALELVKSLCPNLPGEEIAMAGALRKCKDSLSTDEFAVLEKALKAGDTALKSRMVSKAHDMPVGDGDAKKAYDDGISKIMSEKSISKSAAMSSKEGQALAADFRKALAAEEGED